MLSQFERCRAKKFVSINDKDVYSGQKDSAGILANPSVSKQAKGIVASGAGLNAYETNSYAFYQISQRQLRISRKMRVKTPNIGSTKNQGRTWKDIKENVNNINIIWVHL